MKLSLGARHMLASAFFFSLMSFFVKLAGERLPSQEIVVARSVASLVLSWVALRKAGVSPWGWKPGGLVLRGLLGTAALSCFYYALTELPIALVTVLHYLNPPLAALLAWIFLRERSGPLLFLALLASFAGTVLVAQPTLIFGGEERATWPLLAAIAGAVFSAAAYVSVRKLAAREPPLVIVFYFPLVALPITVPTLAFEALWPTPIEWLILLGVGVTTQLGQVHLTKGLAAEATGRATAISYAQVLFAALWGMLWFGELPDAWMAAGAALILLGTLLAARPAGRVGAAASTSAAADSP